jgi:hypothetical protein
MEVIGVLGSIRGSAHRLLLIGLLAGLAPGVRLVAGTLTLAWNQSSDPNVAGYRVYFGTVSRNYTNMVDAGAAITATFSNLAPATTYYFAATTYTAAGLESGFSAETSYSLAVPAQPPTLDPINNLTINEGVGVQTVVLMGITSGASNQTATLTVSAFSSNPGLIPNPVVNYTNPATQGSLSFAPVAGSFGSAVLTVLVDNGQSSSNTVLRSFTVTVNQTVAAQTPLTNATVLPSTLFRYVLNPPYNNGDRFSYALGADAPAGVSIVTRKGISSVVWVPSAGQASTTNLFTIVVTDKTNPSASTNETLLVIVSDYLSIGGGSTTVQAGQSATVPIYLSASDGLTNVTFTLEWPSSRFLNPSLSVVAPASSSSSIQSQSTNLLVNLQVLPGQAISGSNLIAHLSFQTVTNQTSGFVSLALKVVSASKPDGTSYAYTATAAERIVVVNNAPLIEAFASTNLTRSLTLFGKVGTSYQLQYSTNLSSGAWYRLLNYTQSSLSQSVSVDGTIPLIYYRLLQQ